MASRNCLCHLFKKLDKGVSVTVSIDFPPQTLSFIFIKIKGKWITGASSTGIFKLNCRHITSVAFNFPVTPTPPAPNPNCALQTCAADGTCSGAFPCPPPSGQTINVPGDFATIQAAINASNSNDQIIVAPGTYPEQITIPAGKNNLTITSQTPGGAIITNPIGGLVGNRSLVTVNAQCTAIDGFTITGPSLSTSNLLNGILISGGTAVITNNIISDIRDNPIQPTLVGTGINVSSGSASMSGNTIIRYARTGIRINGATTCGTAINNTITGVGPTSVQAQNGIQVSSGATAVIQGNTISANEFVGETFSSTGIVVVQAVEGSPVCLLSNTTPSNDIGIAVVSSSGLLVQTNDNSNDTQVGIFVDENSADNVFIQNTALNDPEWGIADFSTGTGSAFTANSYLCNTCSSDNRDGAICASTSPVAEGRNFPPNGIPPVVQYD